MSKLKYSNQAEFVMSQLKEFKKEEFEKWWIEERLIGGGDIINFVLNKEIRMRKVK